MSKSLPVVEFAIVQGRPVAVISEYETVSGDLHHHIDGVLRAIIKPVNIAEYAQSWKSAKRYIPENSPAKASAGRKRK